MSRQQSFEDRITPEPNTGCWLWMGMYQTGKEYGLFSFKQKTIKAHRAAWTIYRGPIPNGINVLHRCDTPACVNPDHLFLGTQMDNIRDRHSKGRSRGPSSEKAARSKLSPALVKEIRTLRRTGLTISCIAERFAVSASAIDRVVRGETWVDV